MKRRARARANGALDRVGAPPSPPADRSASDVRVVRDCLRGDEQAWAALVSKYKNLIYSIPFKYRLAEEDAADIFQAVCLDLYRELPRLRDTENLRSWLAAVAAHKAFHFKRHHQREAQSEANGALDQGVLAAMAPLPAVIAEAEREHLVREAVARLPPRCRELIQMLFYEQPPRRYAEVARRLGLATGSIGFIRERCLRRVQRILTELGF